MNTYRFYSLALLCLVTTSAFADNHLYFKPFVGASQMSDTSADANNIDGASDIADISIDLGYSAGLAVGFSYSKAFALELAWEYRHNKVETTIDEFNQYPKGTFSSDIVFLNGYYFFESNSRWQPYAGLGLSWANNIEVEIEKEGRKQRYQNDNDNGYQIFVGVDYPVSPQWSAQFEVRYSLVDNTNLMGQSTPGGFRGLDYETLTTQLAVSYHF